MNYLFRFGALIAKANKNSLHTSSFVNGKKRQQKTSIAISKKILIISNICAKQSQWCG